MPPSIAVPSLPSGAPRGIEPTAVGLSYSAMGVVLIIDQLLLPMFHAGGVPYKASFLLLGVWLLNLAAAGTARVFDAESARDFSRFSAAIAAIVACALLGELARSVADPMFDGAEVTRSVLIYVLVVLSFGLGLSSKRLDLRWLLWVLYAAVGVNLALIVLREHLPAPFVNFYFSEAAVKDFGAETVQDILNQLRPRGIAGNPNATAFMINVNALFILVALRHGLLRPPRGVGLVLLLLGPMAVITLLASRGEFLVAALLALLNYREVARRSGQQLRRRMKVGVVVVALVISGAASYLAQDVTIVENAKRIATVLSVLDEADDEFETKNQGIARPLLTAELALERFMYSPVFGTGFSHGGRAPFAHNTQNFHNDWFRLLVTSGVIGAALMLWIVKRYCLPFGLVVLVPFVLPGLINTFLVLIPGVIFYFYMIGVLWAKHRAHTTH